jgi:membrane associated rhomboid family serine protease
MKEHGIWKIIRFPLLFVIILWIIEGLEVTTGVRLIWLGVIPRTISGIPGIFFSPFIHGNYEHLLSNTMPLLVVGCGVIYFYRDIAINVIAMIWLFTGFWVWLAARPEAHIGASGIIYGLVCFLFFSGVLRKDTRLLAVSLLVTFLYGSMVWGILPIDQSISWESHLFGSVAGIFCAVYYRKLGPQRPKAQWEIDEELELLNQSSEFHDDVRPVLPEENIIINYDFIPKKPDDANTDSTEKRD